MNVRVSLVRMVAVVLMASMFTHVTVLQDLVVVTANLVSCNLVDVGMYIVRIFLFMNYVMKN